MILIASTALVALFFFATSGPPVKRSNSVKADSALRVRGGVTQTTPAEPGSPRDGDRAIHSAPPGHSATLRTLSRHSATLRTLSRDCLLLEDPLGFADRALERCVEQLEELLHSLTDEKAAAEALILENLQQAQSLTERIALVLLLGRHLSDDAESLHLEEAAFSHDATTLTLAYALAERDDSHCYDSFTAILRHVAVVAKTYPANYDRFLFLRRLWRTPIRTGTVSPRRMQLLYHILEAATSLDVYHTLLRALPLSLRDLADIVFSQADEARRTSALSQFATQATLEDRVWTVELLRQVARKDSSPMVTGCALEELVEMFDPEAVQIALDRYRASDVPARKELLNRITSKHNSVALEIAWRIWSEENESSLRSAVISAVSRQPPDEAETKLLDMIRTARDEQERVMILAQLGRIGSQRSLRTIDTFQGSTSSAEVVKAAEEAQAQIRQRIPDR